MTSTSIDQICNLHGVNPSAAISAVKDRAARWAAGNYEDDGRKLGLVIEGGAMRGVCSAGGVLALAQLGYADLFDEIYATSAGALNASYFLSQQAELGISIYFDDCTKRLALNPFRVWKILDVDYLIGRIIGAEKRLDVDRILSSRTRFFVAAIEKSTGKGLVIDAHSRKAPLLQLLKAAIAVPFLYNRTVDIDGQLLMDGGLVNPIPIEYPLAAGCTDLVILLTRPANFRFGEPRWIDKQLFNLICARGNSGLNHTYADCAERSHVLRDLALGRVPAPPGVNIVTICTDEPELIKRTTVNRNLLRQAAIEYGRTTLSVFGEDAMILNVPD